MKKARLLFLALLCCLLSGCWQEELPEEEYTTPLQLPEVQMEHTEAKTHLPEVFSLPYLPGQTLDPITCPDGVQQTVASLLCEGLFQLDQTLEPEGVLCESYTYDPDRLVYTFTLRQGTLFSDGSPLTAEDVRATLNRAKSSPRYAQRLAYVHSISTSEGSVKLTLERPNTALPALLDIPIVKKGTENAPIGTGPYCYTVEDTGAMLTANPHYGLPLPLQQIRLAEVSDWESILYRFSSHEVQLITADLTGADSVHVSGNIHYQDAHTPIMQYLGCNVRRAPMDRLALRKAVSLSLNRPHIVSALLAGHATAAQFPVSPASPLYPTDWEEPYSPDAFSAALQGLELPLEAPLVLLVNEENAFKCSIAEEIAATLTEAGLAVTVRALPWEGYTEALLSGDFDLYYGEVKLTADWDLAPLLETGGALNYGGWSDEWTDRLLVEYRSAEDQAAAMEKLCDMLRLRLPILPICFKSTSVLVQSGVIDQLTPTAAQPFYRFTAASVHLQGQ